MEVPNNVSGLNNSNQKYAAENFQGNTTQNCQGLPYSTNEQLRKAQDRRVMCNGKMDRQPVAAYEGIQSAQGVVNHLTCDGFNESGRSSINYFMSEIPIKFSKLRNVVVPYPDLPLDRIGQELPAAVCCVDKDVPEPPDCVVGPVICRKPIGNLSVIFPSKILLNSMLKHLLQLEHCRLLVS